MNNKKQIKQRVQREEKSQQNEHTQKIKKQTNQCEQRAKKYLTGWFIVFFILCETV